MNLLKIYREGFLNELELKSSLDFSCHPIYNTIDLFENYVFANMAKFCHAVATNRACVFHLLACIIDYNIAA